MIILLPSMRTRWTVALAGLGVAGVLAASCSNPSPGNSSTSTMPPPSTRLAVEPFGTLPDGRAVSIARLSNTNGVEVRVMSYGGIIVSLKTPDRTGKSGDIVLGHDDAAAYVPNPNFFGALIG